ncbi:lipoprotein [Salmonella enterica subsp. arizonae]|uniref:Lipoprotein n=1 Tax=Salmonella enterica subsp. arizonae TaxID=59203 RepID=A0A379SL94_SALER|nr:lipoprotein [Salmonella enterica subsp. arizonae]
MKNKKHIFSIIFIGSLLTGCATGPSPTGIGLYTDVKGANYDHQSPGNQNR